MTDTTFDWDLFQEICQKYDVPFSTDYSAVMLEEDGSIRCLCENDIENIMLPMSDIVYNDTSPYENVKLENTPEPIFHLSKEFLLAA